MVEIGDMILSADASGEVSASPVVAIPHGKNSIVSNFVMLSTREGKSLKLTADHLIPTVSCGGNEKGHIVVKAANLASGSCILTVDGIEVVTGNEIVISTGLYTVVTLNDYVVINGIVASPFAVSHKYGSALYGVLKILYMIAPNVIGHAAFQQVYHTISDGAMSYY
jgi:hypothetical protein